MTDARCNVTAVQLIAAALTFARVVACSDGRAFPMTSVAAEYVHDFPRIDKRGCIAACGG